VAAIENRSRATGIAVPLIVHATRGLTASRPIAAYWRRLVDGVPAALADRPRAPTAPAHEPAFLAEFDAIEREAAEVDAAMRDLVACSPGR
jgi:hypothetical protein